MEVPKLNQPSPADDVLDFLLSKPSPEDVIALRPSPEVQERLRTLLDGTLFAA
jgi:hypothetical protein